jgi:CubicO group peptidase (beta-lactamase class C family)
VGAGVSEENEGAATGPEGVGAGVDPVATAMALGGAGRAEADAFLRDQRILIDEQTKLTRLRAQELSHELGLRHWFRDREQKLAMTKDSIFRIASMTKPIVSVGAMILAEEGKLDIGAPVSNYLPEFKDLQVRIEQVDPATGRKEIAMQPQVRPMTVQDLLRHTAGLV